MFRKYSMVLTSFISLSYFVMLFSWNLFSFQEKSEPHQKPDPNRMQIFKQQKVTVEDFNAQGFILDIGGGGEGVIGQIKGPQVIAIDISKRELEDAPPGPLKIVMDGRDLKFVDKSFPTATVFFTFMYIDSKDHKQVFQEIHRVLVDGGRLLIWDVLFPISEDDQKEVALFPLKITLPEKEITTGYGVKWPREGQGLSHYLNLAEETGYEVIAQKTTDMWFFIELKKK
ncbi:MAG: class I SAM-dependent methyltransferase [Candidatus Aminicenantes bacterium]|nr:class I SAM-dependent methyltransferase [Candidatus Aminicenantes bacterium]